MTKIGRLWKLIFVVCLLAVPTESRAQNAFAGIYTGSFFSSGDSGQFAVLLRTNGVAIFLAFDNFDETGFVNQSVTVAANGSFSKTNIDGEGTNITGQFTAGGLSGTYTSPGVTGGTFSGSRRSNAGSTRSIAGFYSGPLAGDVFVNGADVGDFNATFYYILSADGVGTSLIEGPATVLGQTEQFESGNFDVGITPSNICTSFSAPGASFTCSFNSSTFTYFGSFAFSDSGISISGDWSLTRQEPLPNNAPVAVADSYATTGSRSLVIAAPGVLANDSDPEGDPITASLVSGPANGSVTLQFNGGFTYNPTAGFDGVDSFSYRAGDGLAFGNTASVTIAVEGVVALPWLPLLLE